MTATSTSGTNTRKLQTHTSNAQGERMPSSSRARSAWITQPANKAVAIPTAGNRMWLVTMWNTSNIPNFLTSPKKRNENDQALKDNTFTAAMTQAAIAQAI